MTHDLSTESRTISPWKRLVMWGVFICVLGVVLCMAVVTYMHSAPSTDIRDIRVVITEGQNFRDIARMLRDAGVVRSSLVLEVCARLTGAAHVIQAGEYVFPTPQSACAAAELLRTGETLVPPVTITIPEGSTIADIDAIVHAALPRIGEGAIEHGVGGQEGVLFPDTYHIPSTYDAEDIVTLLRTTFDDKLASRAEALAASQMSTDDVIILASIVEKEANSEESMRMVADILLRRLAIDMPLQVDATYAYGLGKASHELTEEELRADSPWNTYSRRGLPQGPIGSPGLMAIDAVLHPLPNDYWYYLTDTDGVFHFAKTFDEHKENKALYLN